MKNQEMQFRSVRTTIRVFKSLCILLSIFSCQVIHSVDIFKAIESNNKKEIQQWLKVGSDLDMVNDQGQTVLMKSVQVGNKFLVKKLLRKKADTNHIDNAGKSALDYAAELRQDKIALMLAKKKAIVTNEQNLVIVRDLVVARTKKIVAISKVLVWLALGCILPIFFIPLSNCLLIDCLHFAALALLIVDIPVLVAVNSWAQRADIYLPCWYQINKKQPSCLFIREKAIEAIH